MGNLGMKGRLSSCGIWSHNVQLMRAPLHMSQEP